MTYFGIKYLFIFLPAVICLYAIMPKKLKPLILLLASYALIFYISRWLIIFILLSTLIIYTAGIIMQKITEHRDILLKEKEKDEKKKIKLRYKRYKK